jgi:hypothetical protein
MSRPLEVPAAAPAEKRCPGERSTPSTPTTLPLCATAAAPPSLGERLAGLPRAARAWLLEDDVPAVDEYGRERFRHAWLAWIAMVALGAFLVGWIIASVSASGEVPAPIAKDASVVALLELQGRVEGARGRRSPQDLSSLSNVAEAWKRACESGDLAALAPCVGAVRKLAREQAASLLAGGPEAPEWPRTLGGMAAALREQSALAAGLEQLGERLALFGAVARETRGAQSRKAAEALRAKLKAEWDEEFGGP